MELCMAFPLWSKYHQCCSPWPDVLVIAAVFEWRMLQGTWSLIHSQKSLILNIFYSFKCFKWWLPSFISLWFSRCYVASGLVWVIFHTKSPCTGWVGFISIGSFNHKCTIYFIFLSISKPSGRTWSFCMCVGVSLFLGWQRKIRRGDTAQIGVLCGTYGFHLTHHPYHLKEVLGRNHKIVFSWNSGAQIGLVEGKQGSCTDCSGC